MNQEQIDVIKQCAAASLAGQLSFGETVGRLSAVGVERYHADYSRMEHTYYLPDGDSLVLSMDHAPAAIATLFTRGAIEASVRQAQRGEIVYPQFVKQTAEAGCIGYFVQIAGKRVHYFGRAGDLHTEWSPVRRRNNGGDAAGSA